MVYEADTKTYFRALAAGQMSTMSELLHGSETSWKSDLCYPYCGVHYSYVIMSAVANQITSLTIVYSTVYSGADQRTHQSSVSLVFVLGIHSHHVSIRLHGMGTLLLLCEEIYRCHLWEEGSTWNRQIPFTDTRNMELWYCLCSFPEQYLEQTIDKMYESVVITRWHIPLRRRRVTVTTSRITSHSRVCLAVCLNWQRRHIKGPPYYFFVKGIHLWPMVSAQRDSNGENVSIWWRHHESSRT